MNLKLIICDVFRREICMAMLGSPHAIFPVFTEKRSHERPDELRKTLQKEIDGTTKGKYDYIILGYGLCGNATAGLAARETSLVIPRAHDCCTILLGSRDRFMKNFGHRPSCRWRSGGYMEGGEDYLYGDGAFRGTWLNTDYQALVDLYGEENAQYLTETMALKDGNDKHSIYIRTAPYRDMGFERIIAGQADEKGTTLELIEGDNRLLQMLVDCDWPEEEFLIVPPGHVVAGVYDHDIIIKAIPAE